MVGPMLSAGVEQFGQVAGRGIKSGQVRSLVQIAVDARQGEVFQVVASAVDPRDDVLDVEGSERGIVLVKLAVLAAVFGVFPHLGSAPCVHRLGRGAADFPGEPFEDGDEFVGADVALVYRALGFAQFAFGGFGGSFLNAGLKFRGPTKSEHSLRHFRKDDSARGRTPRSNAAPYKAAARESF